MRTLAFNAASATESRVRQSYHVAYGVLSLDLGGLERLVVDLVQANLQRNHRVSVICVEKPGRLAGKVEELGAQVYCLHKPYGRSPATIPQATDLLKTLQPDVLHTHQIGALWHLGNAAQSLRTLPVVHTEHSDHVAMARGWFEKVKTRLWWRRAAPLARRFCCVSEDVARSVRRWGTVPRSKVDVVLNGIDIRKYSLADCGAEIRSGLEIPPGTLVMGTVGRLVEVKRQDLLIRAFAALQSLSDEPGMRLLIVGDGPERSRLEALAEELGVEEEVIFAGYQPHPEQFLQAMDLFVLSSRHEGLPLALLEAWAAGLCVVSSAVGAIPQTVLHGVNGMLFPSGDQQALTETLRKLLDSPETVARLGRAGKLRAEHRYSLDRMADEYERRYRTLVTK